MYLYLVFHLCHKNILVYKYTSNYSDNISLYSYIYIHLGSYPCAAIFVLITTCDRKENKNDLKIKKRLLPMSLQVSFVVVYVVDGGQTMIGQSGRTSTQHLKRGYNTSLKYHSVEETRKEVPTLSRVHFITFSKALQDPQKLAESSTSVIEEPVGAIIRYCEIQFQSQFHF